MNCNIWRKKGAMMHYIVGGVGVVSKYANFNWDGGPFP